MNRFAADSITLMNPVKFCLNSTGTLGFPASNSGCFTWNEWRRLVIVRDMDFADSDVSTIKFYLDGQLASAPDEFMGIDNSNSVGVPTIDLFEVNADLRAKIAKLSAARRASALPTILIRV
jgi:hypothetical protein